MYKDDRHVKVRDLVGKNEHYFERFMQLHLLISINRYLTYFL